MGGGAAVSIQSMCNTPTEDVNATVRQIQRLEQAGCEIVRVASNLKAGYKSYLSNGRGKSPARDDADATAAMNKVTAMPY